MNVRLYSSYDKGYFKISFLQLKHYNFVIITQQCYGRQNISRKSVILLHGILLPDVTSYDKIQLTTLLHMPR